MTEHADHQDNERRYHEGSSRIYSLFAVDSDQESVGKIRVDGPHHAVERFNNLIRSIGLRPHINDKLSPGAA